jgi:hypothetical protein
VNDESIFAQLGSLIKVRHVQQKLGPRFPEDMPLEEAKDILQEWMETHASLVDVVFLVVEDGQPVGCHDFSMGADIECELEESPESVVGDIMIPLTLSSIVSADLPLLEAIELLLAPEPTKTHKMYAGHLSRVRERQSLLVLDGKELTGVITYGDAFTLPGVMCLFALMVELEAASLRLCQAFSEQCWAALPERRQKMAWEVFRKRFPPEREESKQQRPEGVDEGLLQSLIECTMFIDKATMIGKCKLLIDVGRSKLNSIFNRAQEVRNACAHPAENKRLESILPRPKFSRFLKDCRQLIDSIRLVTPR